MKRGEIYFIERHDSIGSETAKARPGIIVSNNVLNATSSVVEVVYLTTAPKKEMPTHAVINATGRLSIAICEHIDHISKSLVGDFCGECSEEEMADIDKALLCSLGIEVPKENALTEQDKRMLKAAFTTMEQLKADRDRYAKMVDHLLEAKA